jgi:hypothetical protein
MALDKFIPLSPDPDLNAGSDMTLARFGHLNQVVDYINAGCAGGSTIYVNGSGINSVNKSETIGNLASGAGSVILNGTNNSASGCRSVVLNGSCNLALGLFSIAHGDSNCAINDYSVAIGFKNRSTKTYGFVFGACNINESPNSFNLSTISGGYLNYNCASLSFIGSGISNRIEGGSCNVLVGGEQNCIVKLYPGVIASNFIGAGRYNKILAAVTNCVDSIHSTIAGGCGNVICGSEFGTIPGGAFNRVDNAAQIVVGGGIAAGGAFNIVSSEDGSILAGRSNTVTGCRSSIIGGTTNNVSSCYSSILGGTNNTANQPYSAVFGCNITSSMACAFHTNRLVLTNLPNSSVGLPSGAVWYDPADGNRVKYVP